MSQPLQMIVFDCDGTLIDSQHMIVAAMNHAFEKHGLDALPRKEVLSIVGLSLDEAMAALMPQAEAALRTSLREGYKEAFFTLRSRKDLAEPLFEGIRETLEVLAQRPDTLMGIATGKSQKGLRHALETHALKHHFVTLQTADDAPSKPHPEMLHRAMAETGVRPEDTVLVGDTSYDMAMARAAGAHALGVVWGYHPKEALARAGAHQIIAQTDDIVPAVERLLSASIKDDALEGGAI